MGRFKVGPITDDGPLPAGQTDVIEVLAVRLDEWVVKLQIGDKGVLFLNRRS